jgi:hypothetical protein
MNWQLLDPLDLNLLDVVDLCGYSMILVAILFGAITILRR